MFKLKYDKCSESSRMARNALAFASALFVSGGGIC